MTVDISCTHLHLSDVCSEYLTDEAPLFSVGADEEHKEELRKFFLGSSQVFSDAFLESIAVQEKICAAVLDYDAAVFHAALIAFDGQGVAFAAPSGTGKTTHIKLWQRLYGDRSFLCVRYAVVRKGKLGLQQDRSAESHLLHRPRGTKFDFPP